MAVVVIVTIADTHTVARVENTVFLCTVNEAVALVNEEGVLSKVISYVEILSSVAVEVAYGQTADRAADTQIIEGFRVETTSSIFCQYNQYCVNKKNLVGQFRPTRLAN